MQNHPFQTIGQSDPTYYLQKRLVEQSARDSRYTHQFLRICFGERRQSYHSFVTCLNCRARRHSSISSTVSRQAFGKTQNLLLMWIQFTTSGSLPDISVFSVMPLICLFNVAPYHQNGKQVWLSPLTKMAYVVPPPITTQPATMP